MEVTHFIEVWRFSDGQYGYSTQPWRIELFNSAIKYTEKVDGKTIAIFKIRQKNISLDERLRVRSNSPS
jgi:hypothetical protein